MIAKNYYLNAKKKKSKNMFDVNKIIWMCSRVCICANSVALCIRVIVHEKEKIFVAIFIYFTYSLFTCSRIYGSMVRIFIVNSSRVSRALITERRVAISSLVRYHKTVGIFVCCE